MKTRFRMTATALEDSDGALVVSFGDPDHMDRRPIRITIPARVTAQDRARWILGRDYWIDITPADDGQTKGD